MFSTSVHYFKKLLYLEGGGPMNGDSSGLYLLNSYSSNTIQNFQTKGLNETKAPTQL